MVSTSSQQEKENIPVSSRASITHILPAITVFILLVNAAIYADLRATSFENLYARALAPLLLSRDEIGTVMQQAAFRQADLLPVYGSSEMLETRTPYRAFDFFATYPTGFNVFNVARLGDTSLNMAEDLASIGPALKGRKVVISFTPSMFTYVEVKNDVYASNFSRMHANAFIFSSSLSMTIKRLAAKRMLEYPDTLENDPVLNFAIKCLVENSPNNDFFYYLIFPLGQLDNFILRLQDHFSNWQFASSHPSITPDIQVQPRSINWKQIIATADLQQQLNTNSNIYGIDNRIWRNNRNLGFEIRRAGSRDQDYWNRLERSREWEDLKILLDVLQELGAKPLILCRPINGTLYQAAGVSSSGQDYFYIKLRDTIGYYNFPLIDFKEYTNDRYFSVDFASHTSPKGWVLVDQALDDFYHDRIGN